jgi:uncharacterized protein YjbI with pentapeptide repeats
MNTSLDSRSTKGSRAIQATSAPNILRSLVEQSRLNQELRATIRGMNISGQLRGLDLSCCDFQNCSISDATFFECDLRGASFQNSLIYGVEFAECDIFDMEIPANCKSAVYHNCSNLPTGL